MQDNKEKPFDLDQFLRSLSKSKPVSPLQSLLPPVASAVDKVTKDSLIDSVLELLKPKK